LRHRDECACVVSVSNVLCNSEKNTLPSSRGKKDAGARVVNVLASKKKLCHAPSPPGASIGIVSCPGSSLLSAFSVFLALLLTDHGKATRENNPLTPPLLPGVDQTPSSAYLTGSLVCLSGRFPFLVVVPEGRA
jgi:hypothetical protein